MDLPTLTDRTRRRLGLVDNDPMIERLPFLVMDAIRDLEVEADSGWPWQRASATLTLTVGVGTYTFATIGAAMTPATSIVSKIVQVRRRGSGSTDYAELQRRSLSEADGLYPYTSNGTPHVWAAEGNALYLRPLPIAADTLYLTVIASEPDLTESDATEPLMPERFQPAIIEQAVAYGYMELQDPGKAQIAQQRADRWVKKMRRSGRQYVGPGMVRAENR